MFERTERELTEREVRALHLPPRDPLNQDFVAWYAITATPAPEPQDRSYLATVKKILGD